MKSLFLCFGFSALALSASHAASAFWSFQSVAAGGTYNGSTTALPSNGTVTTNSGFLGTPSLTTFAGSGGASVSGTGGGTNFQDPSTGTIWAGNGTDAPAVGWSTQWGSNTTQNLTGAGFSLALNTTGLSDLSLRFDLRSASTSNTTANGQQGAITSFSSISYRTDGGAWIALSGVSLPTWSLQGAWQNDIALDLSSYSELENQSNLELQFVFNGGAKSATSTPTQNFRLDNLLVSAVPEPASAVLAAVGVLGLAVRRRR